MNKFRASQNEFLQQRYWVDICNPTSEQMEMLEKAFGLHPLTTEDILTTGNPLYSYNNHHKVILNL